VYNIKAAIEYMPVISIRSSCLHFRFRSNHFEQHRRLPTTTRKKTTPPIHQSEAWPFKEKKSIHSP